MVGVLAMTTAGRYSKLRLGQSIKEGLAHWSTSTTTTTTTATTTVTMTATITTTTG